MRIKSDPPGGFVELEFDEVDLNYPSLALSIQIENKGFQGSKKGIWFRQSDLDRFILELEDVERQRRGEAILRTMSDMSDYAPFHLKIFSTDNYGHFAIVTDLLQTDYIGSMAMLVANKVSVAFDIDPTMLPYLLADLKKLFAQR